jgi:hypothetical protein
MIFSKQILRIKKFSMNPISVLEAAKAMDLIDHPFYTFRNIEVDQTTIWRPEFIYFSRLT